MKEKTQSVGEQIAEKAVKILDWREGTDTKQKILSALIDQELLRVAQENADRVLKFHNSAIDAARV